MEYWRFRSRINHISTLIRNDSRQGELSEYIEEDPDLMEYLAQNEDWSQYSGAGDPLTAAAYFGRDSTLELLLSKYGMAVNARCEDGCSYSANALTWAVANNNVSCVRVLLKHRADMDKAGRIKGTNFRNAMELDKLCKAGKIDSISCVVNSDDRINKMLEEEAERRKGGGEGTKISHTIFYFTIPVFCLTAE